jgi:outer membrane biosynthesis protein TonB
MSDCTRERSPLPSRRRRTAVGGVAVAILAAASSWVAAQDGRTPSSAHAPTAADEPAVGNPEDYEVLRRLLGVPSPPPPLAVPPEPAASQVEEAREPEPPSPEPASTPKSAKPSTPVAKKAAPPPRKAVAKKAAAPKAVAKAPEPEPDSPESGKEAPAVAVATPDADMPAVGEVLAGADAVTRYSHLLAPSVQWAVLRGAKIRVGERKPIPMEDARAAATQRYHGQVVLSADRREMRNYVAGMPFPLVQKEDRDAAVKIIFNQQARLTVDDMDARKMGCHIGSIHKERGFQLERTFQIEHWRRLYYVGRLYHPPVPTMPTKEGVRYRELQYPLIEPFDLKGGGWNYIRYNDVDRPDDGWAYYPVMRRVRRLSTAQRSQGIFGQDMDLDSYTGYAGNPAWMQWRLVGTKTMLAPMHSEHVPVRWQAAPADFEPDEPWEAREMYVVEGRSLLPEYAFARRVVYVDRESWLIPYSEIYDDQGKLWKALHQAWGFGRKVRDDAGGREFEEFYLPGYSMIDMQIDHVTRCELPLSTAVGDKGWYYNYGDAEGTTEQAFGAAGFIGETH